MAPGKKNQQLFSIGRKKNIFGVRGDTFDGFLISGRHGSRSASVSRPYNIYAERAAGREILPDASCGLARNGKTEVPGTTQRRLAASICRTRLVSIEIDEIKMTRDTSEFFKTGLSKNHATISINLSCPRDYRMETEGRP